MPFSFPVARLARLVAVVVGNQAKSVLELESLLFRNLA